jgi:hypothetical protein
MLVDKKTNLNWGYFLNRTPFTLLRASLNNIVQHPVILFPTATLAFIQLLLLEILYFAPQKPLSIFFGPLIKSIWSEEYMHYPQNLILLPKMFYYVQIIIYLVLGSFFLAFTSKIVSVLNVHPRVNLKSSFKETLSTYIHIFFASIISYILFQILANGYVKILNYIINIKPFGASVSFWNKTLLWTIPYFQFLLGILASTLIVYVVPIIVIEKLKIFPAILKNFRVLFHSFPTTILIVGLPSLFYLPILALRNNVPFLMHSLAPEIQLIVIILSLLISMGVDLMIIVSTTTLYLFVKENT